MATALKEKRLTIQMPTATGKTYVGIRIIREVIKEHPEFRWLIIVPKEEVLDRWRRDLPEAGVFYGKEKKPDQITVSIYNSGVLHPDILSNFDGIMADECFTYNTSVRLENGERRGISAVVNTKYDGKVLSYNFQKGQWAAKRVIGWIRKRPGCGLVRIMFTQRFSGVTCTLNHELFSSDRWGWVSAKRLKIGEHVLVRPKEEGRWRIPRCLGAKQWQVVLGSSLGDATIIRSAKMARLRFTQSAHQRAYLNHKRQVLSTLLFTPLSHTKTEFSPVTGVYVSTSACSVELADRGYVDDEVIRELTPLGLAYWYMDDGSLSSGCMVRLHVEGRSIEVARKMCAALDEWFGFGGGCKVTLAKGCPVIVFTVEATKKFSRLVAPFIIPSMQYKLLSTDRGQYREWKPDPKPYAISRVEGKVSKQLAGTKPYMREVYCIDVEDNHNFIAGNALVHNCHHISAPVFRQLLELSSKHEFMVGFTATFERRDGLHTYAAQFIPVKFYMSVADAQKYGAQCPLDLYVVRVDLAKEVLDKVKMYDRVIMQGFRRQHSVWMWPRLRMWRELTCLNQRKKILSLADEKVKALVTISKMHKGKRVLVFGGNIDAIDKLAKILRRNDVTAEAYHSKLDPAKAESIRADSFAAWGRDFDVLLSVQKLDEGVDVPEAKIAIMLASGRGDLQMIQRTGRIMRPSADSEAAKLYLIIAAETNEESLRTLAIRALKLGKEHVHTFTGQTKLDEVIFKQEKPEPKEAQDKTGEAAQKHA